MPHKKSTLFLLNNVCFNLTNNKKVVIFLLFSFATTLFTRIVPYFSRVKMPISTAYQSYIYDFQSMNVNLLVNKNM